MQIVFLGAMVLVFYFFFIRPQMQQQKKLKNLQENLKKGQLVVTSGGIHGKVSFVDENKPWVKIDVGNTQIKVDKSAITGEPGNDDNAN